MSYTTGRPLVVDHGPDAAAPRPRTSPTDRLRFAVLTAATVVLAGGVVLAVAELLPVLPAWVLPVLLTLLTVVFTALGRRAAASGSTAAERAACLSTGGVDGVVVAAGVLRVRGLLRQGVSLRGSVPRFLAGFARRAVRVDPS